MSAPAKIKVGLKPPPSPWFLDREIEHYSWVESGTYTSPQGEVFILPNNKGFGAFIQKKFGQYKSQPESTFKCGDQSLNVNQPMFPHQAFVADYMAPDRPYRGLLVDHDLGSGKTRTAIATAEPYRLMGVKILILLKASLKPTWIKEIKTWGHPDLRRPANYSQLSVVRQSQIDYEIDRRIAEGYDFVTYNAGNTLQQLNKVTSGQLKHRLVIVEEAHNLLSIMANPEGKLGYNIYKLLMSAIDCKFLFLSATPLLNFSFELAIMFNILKGVMMYKGQRFTLFPETEGDFDDYFVDYDSKKVVNPELFKKRILGLVSYYSGAKADVYPDLVFMGSGPIKVEFSDYQFQAYAKVRLAELDKEKTKTIARANLSGVNSKAKVSAKKNEVSSTFRIFSRQFSNFAFPPDVRRPMPADFRGSDEIKLDANPDHWTSDQVTDLSNLLGNDHDHFLKFKNKFEKAKTDQAKLKMVKELIGNNGLGIDDFGTLITRHTGRQFTGLGQMKLNADPEKWTEAQDEQLRLMFEYDEDALTQFRLAYKDLRTDAQRLKFLDDKIKNSDPETTGGEFGDLVSDEEQFMMEHLDLPDSYQQAITNALRLLSYQKNKYFKEDLATLSPKMLEVYKNLMENKGSAGTALVYSQFLTLEGVNIFALVLEAHGFERLPIESITEANLAEFVGKKRYVIFSGGEDNTLRNRILQIFNHDLNKHGEICKVFMGTSAAAEGLSLKNTQQVHVLEPYWNKVRIQQVIGRARRICSHEGLPKADRKVYVYIYESVMSPSQKAKFVEKVSTDEAIWDIAKLKEEINQQFLQILKDAAVDCTLNAYYNITADNPIVCFAFPEGDVGVAYYPSLGSDTSDKMSAVKHKQEKIGFVPFDMPNLKGNSLYYDDKGQYLYVYKHDLNPREIKKEKIRIPAKNVIIPAIVLYDRALAEHGNNAFPRLAIVDTKQGQQVLPAKVFEVMA